MIRWFSQLEDSDVVLYAVIFDAEADHKEVHSNSGVQFNKGISEGSHDQINE